MNEMQSRSAESWKFTAANTAAIVVDMQDIWVHPRGARYLPTSEILSRGFKNCYDIVTIKNSRRLSAHDQAQRFGRRRHFCRHQTADP